MLVRGTRIKDQLSALIAHKDWLHLVLLAGILVLASLLRFWGLRFGLPYFDHPDEWAVGDEALRMLWTGDFSPKSFTYPTLYVYLQVGVAALHYVWGSAIGLYASPETIDPARFYVWARALTATLGVALVGLTYGIGRKVYGRAVGLIAALFLAVLPTAAADAHYITVDTPAAFFTALAFLLILKIEEPGDAIGSARQQQPPNGRRLCMPWRVLVAGVAVGLAASTKYTAGVAVVPLFVACVWQNNPRATIGDSVRSVITAGLGVACGFTLGTPLWIPELPRLIADVEAIARHYREIGHPGAESSRPALFYLDELYFEATLITCTMVGGGLLVLVRRSRADLLILALVVPFMLQLNSVRVVFFRNVMPLMPFACLLAAMVTFWVVRYAVRVAKQRAQPQTAWLSTFGWFLLIIIVAVLIAQPLTKALRDEWLLAQPTTRILATEWVLAHAPVGVRVWLEDQTLILPPKIRVEGGRPLTTHPPEWYREQGFRFLVVNDSIAKSDATQLAAFGEPVVRFETAGQRLGHTFLIYDTGIADPAQDVRTSSGATLAGGALILDGYNHAQQAAPGSVLRLALYWKVERALDHDYVVFVHLVDVQGNKQAQRDTPPLDGSRPTSTWQVGELIRDDQDLPLPNTIPAGRYTLLVGMYDATTLISINDSGPTMVGEIEVP